jgi:tRNA(fMet)-specific endonuclease VapC
MVCLDSDIIIDFLRKKEYAIKKIKEFQENEIELTTTSINTFEIFKGFINLNKNINEIYDFLRHVKVINFNFQCSKKAAEISEFLKSKGEALDIADIMIASIAITNNEALLTNNLSHFKRISELKILEI